MEKLNTDHVFMNTESQTSLVPPKNLSNRVKRAHRQLSVKIVTQKQNDQTDKQTPPTPLWFRKSAITVLFSVCIQPPLPAPPPAGMIDRLAHWLLSWLSHLLISWLNAQLLCTTVGSPGFISYINVIHCGFIAALFISLKSYFAANLVNGCPDELDLWYSLLLCSTLACLLTSVWLSGALENSSVCLGEEEV